MNEREHSQCVEWVEACWRLEYGAGSRENGVNSFSLDLKDDLLLMAVGEPDKSSHSNVNKPSNNSNDYLESTVKFVNPKVEDGIEEDFSHADNKPLYESKNCGENIEPAGGGHVLNEDDSMGDMSEDEEKFFSRNPSENIERTIDDHFPNDSGSFVEKPQIKSENSGESIKNVESLVLDINMDSYEDEKVENLRGNVVGTDSYSPGNNERTLFDSSNLWTCFTRMRQQNTFLTMSSLETKTNSASTDFHLVDNPEKYEKPLSRVLLTNWREDEFTPLEVFAPYIAIDEDDQKTGALTP